ncbi:B-cell receptor CD22-like isoform X2 [Engystomops pustulosus]|uniref:B-cell receptor CD22-like isoform X2 n=1 Tax=Engystomops pustulosus TaxID=76066 RepID=UPI003AFA0B8E
MEALQQIYLLLICQGFYLGSVCQRWTFPSGITALIGSCVEIPCTYHPGGTSDASGTVWYSNKHYDFDPVILNTEDSSSVIAEYKDRTSLVPGHESCTLRIDPVRKADDGGEYYPGIDTSLNAQDKQSRTVRLHITGTSYIQLSVPDIMTEGEATTIRCAVDHTCGSSPPDLQWNKPGHVIKKSVDLKYGSWREESELTYTPSYEDDGSLIQCTATHPIAGKRTKTLSILYAPKNVTVIGMDEVMEGSDVTLQCNSVSRPDVSEYEWYKGETRLPDRGREMTVRNVTRDKEPYSCVARNTVGRGESAPIQITVTYAPAGVHITVRNDHELVCDFRSSRPDVTHYTWMKDGSILHNETGKTLTIDNNGERYGRYSCIAHNTAGNSSSQEIHIQREVNLLMILGIVAGIFILLFLILIVYIRRKKKSTLKTSANYGRVSTSSPHSVTMTMDENQYGNIRNNHHTQPLSIESEPCSHRMKLSILLSPIDRRTGVDLPLLESSMQILWIMQL